MTLNDPQSDPLLTRENLGQFALARQRGKKIRTATTIATCDAWITATFAALTILFGLTSPWALAVGCAMAVIATVAFRGAYGLRHVHEPAARWLGYNQLAFASLLIMYALHGIWQIFTGDSPLATTPELTQMLGSIEDLTRTIYLVVYASLIVVAVIGQGLTALYYFTRARHIRAYREHTPSWILQLHESGMLP